MKFSIGEATVVVNTPTWADMEHRVADLLSRGQGFALATINLDHLVKLRTSAEFRQAYAEQDIVVADGNPIVWASKLAGKPVELIPGSDAILPLARIAADQGVKVAFVGSSDSALLGAKSYLNTNVPGLEVVCTISPPMGFDSSGRQGEEVLRAVADSGARLCFIALGAPKQEVFAALGRKVAPEVGFASIGAGLDFFAGTQKRAPEWARRYSIEWLWRMVRSPRRLGMRYVKCFAILPGQMLRALALRLSGGQT